jgi:hypothetical protein
MWRVANGLENADFFVQIKALNLLFNSNFQPMVGTKIIQICSDKKTLPYWICKASKYFKLAAMK